MSAAPARQSRPIPHAQPSRGAAFDRAAQSARSTSSARAAQAARTAQGARAGQAARAAQPAYGTRSTRHLRAVAAPEQSRSLVPFAWLCALIVVGALGAVLLINTSMAGGAYERRSLKIEIAELHNERSALATELERNAAPATLAKRAKGLGMRPATVLGFVSLSDSVVIEDKGR